MRGDALRVGELARRTGLTVRTLHHYDEIGLVKPSRHGEPGYRLYTAHDLARLDERMQEVPRDRENLMAEVRAEKERGTPPDDPGVLELARRWMALVREFTRGDPGIARSLDRVWKESGDQTIAEHSMENDPRELFSDLGPALESLTGSG